MEDLSIYNDGDNGIYLQGFIKSGEDVLSLGAEDDEDYVSHVFTRDQVIRLRDWLSELIEETAPPPPPTNADIIEEIPFGTTFKYEGATGYVTTYFRFAGGVMSSGGSTYSDFSVFNEGPTIEIEETN